MNRARDYFSDIFERMRQQMAWLLSHQIPNRSGIQLDVDNKGNKTSETKIIDGHKYTINETTYSDGDDNGGSFFKVRVVDIRPVEDKTVLPLPKDDSFENDVNRPFQKVGSPEKIQLPN